MRLLILVLRAVLVPLWLTGVGIYFFCTFHAVTLVGRAGLTGISLLCSVALLFPCFCLPLRSCSKRQRRWFAVAGGLGLLLLLPLPLLSPAGLGGDQTLVAEHVYTSEQARPSRFSVSWMVPEVDQILMGVGLARYVDPYLDAPRASRLRSLSLKIYQELSRDPALGQLGSMLGAANLEGVFREAPVGGHYLALVPRESTAGKRVPLVVFLHGSAGNFASYWKVLAPLARQHEVAVICPTFGFGNWYKRGGVKQILAGIKHARRRYPVITGPTYLVGLSNGGTGVTPAVARCRGCFAGVAYISGVFSGRAALAGVKAGAWRALPVLVIHGHRDLRIPPWAIKPALKRISEGGAKLSRLEYAQEDHFLFFAKRARVVQRIAAWVHGSAR